MSKIKGQGKNFQTLPDSGSNS